MAKWNLDRMEVSNSFDYWEIQWMIGLAHAYMDLQKTGDT